MQLPVRPCNSLLKTTFTGSPLPKKNTPSCTLGHSRCGPNYPSGLTCHRIPPRNASSGHQERRRTPASQPCPGNLAHEPPFLHTLPTEAQHPSSGNFLAPAPLHSHSEWIPWPPISRSFQFVSQGAFPRAAALRMPHGTPGLVQCPERGGVRCTFTNPQEFTAARGIMPSLPGLELRALQ